MAYKLVVEDADGPRGEIRLQAGQNLIGRSPQCEVRIDTPFASRRHAKVLVHEEQVEIFDLESHNGIFVNGEKVRHRQLEIGDAVFLGTRRLMLASAQVGESTMDPDSQLTRAPRPAALTKSLDSLQESGARQILDSGDPVVRNLSILYRVTERFRGAASAEEFLNDVLELVRDLTQATTAVLLLVDSAGELQPRSVLREGVAPRGGEPPVHWPLARKVLDEGVALFSKDLKADPSLTSGLWELEDVGAVMCVPIFQADHTAGCIYLTRPFADAGFSDREVETVTAVAHLLASRLATAETDELAQRPMGLESLLDLSLPPRMADRILQQATGGPFSDPPSQREDGVVLFAELTGFDEVASQESTERVSALLGRFHAEIYAVVKAQGGYVESNFGSGAMAFFPDAGEPSSATSAIRAAVEITARRARLGESAAALGVRVGVDHGTVISGLFGEENRRVYSIVGGVVRTATRIAEIAQPGQILCTAAVREGLEPQSSVQVVALGPHALRGRAEPVTLFLVDTTTRAGGRLPQ